MLVFTRNQLKRLGYWVMPRAQKSFQSTNNYPKFEEKINENPNLSQIKQEFRKYTGGKVSLIKREENGIAYLCLDHSEKKNGLSGSMMVDLNDAISELETWKSGKGVLFHSTGNFFCSGGYLDTVKSICNPQDGFKMCSLMQDSVIKLSNLHLVTVAVVQGPAIGGGAELTLATDFRLFTPPSYCRFVEANMGVGTGWGGGTLLRRLVGVPKALEVLLTCSKISSEDALVMGLADGLVSEHSCLEDAETFLNRLIKNHHPSTVHVMKNIVACDDFEVERRVFSSTWGGPEQQRALNSKIKHK